MDDESGCNASGALSLIDQAIEVGGNDDIYMMLKEQIRRSMQNLNINPESNETAGDMSADEYNTQGNSFLEPEKYADAKQAYQKAISIDPNVSPYYGNRDTPCISKEIMKRPVFSMINRYS